MDYINKEFTLDNNKKYVVIEQVNYNENIYLYIANSNDENDTMYVEIKDNNLLKIEPSLFEQHIFPLFLEKFRQ